MSVARGGRQPRTDVEVGDNPTVTSTRVRAGDDATVGRGATKGSFLEHVVLRDLPHGADPTFRLPSTGHRCTRRDQSHMPTGVGWGFTKIETFEAVYHALGRRTRRARILCGDFNSPQEELADGRVEPHARQRGAGESRPLVFSRDGGCPCKLRRAALGSRLFHGGKWALAISVRI